jgi:hypothetical protein
VTSATNARDRRAEQNGWHTQAAGERAAANFGVERKGKPSVLIQASTLQAAGALL